MHPCLGRPGFSPERAGLLRRAQAERQWRQILRPHVRGRCVLAPRYQATLGAYEHDHFFQGCVCRRLSGWPTRPTDFCCSDAANIIERPTHFRTHMSFHSFLPQHVGSAALGTPACAFARGAAGRGDLFSRRPRCAGALSGSACAWLRMLVRDLLRYHVSHILGDPRPPQAHREEPCLEQPTAPPAHKLGIMGAVSRRWFENNLPSAFCGFETHSALANIGRWKS